MMGDPDLPSRGPRPRILLVDDSELNRDIIAARLTRAGYAVEVAVDGESAWEMTWAKRFDLVLMDLEMPGMSGFEASARIRAREGIMSGVLIAAFTATVAPDAERYSLWSGIDAFIPKSVQPAQLVERIEALMAGRAGADGDDWKPVWRLHAFSDWTCDLDPDEETDCLDELESLFDEATAAIHVHATDGVRFRAITAKLGTLAGRYGFDEVAGVCALYGEFQGGRSRDPNLLGAIGRARYAVTVYRQEHAAQPPQGLWSRTRTSVQSLFGTRRAA